MAIDLKRRGFAEEIYGVEAEPVNAAAAEKIGLVDRMVSFEECVDLSDVIVIAVPVATAVMYAAAAALATAWLPASGIAGAVASFTVSVLRNLLHALNWVITAIASLT